MAPQRQLLRAGRGVPDARGLVVRRGDDAPAVGRERRRSDIAFWIRGSAGLRS